MFCSNCGHKLQETDIFCPNCGTQNAAATNSQQSNPHCNVQPDGRQTVYNTQSDNPQYNYQKDPQTAAAYELPVPAAAMDAAPRKKKGKKIAIAVCSVIAVAAASTIGVLAATGRLSSFFRKTVSDPNEYLQYITEKEMNTYLDSFNASYAAYSEMLADASSGETMNCSITLGKSVQSLLAIAAPELSELESASFTAAFQQDGSAANIQLTAGINQEELLTINAYMDPDKPEGYLQIPELSDSYLDFSPALEDMREELEQSGQDYKALAAQMNSVLPDADALNRIFKNYYSPVWENVKDVEKDSGTLKAGGIEQDCTVLTATLDGEYAYNLTTDLFDILSKDEDIKDIIKNQDEDAYDSFIQEIESTLNDLKENKDELELPDMKLKMKLYVNDDDLIIGRELKGTVEGTDIDIRFHMPQNGDDFAYSACAVIDDTELFSLDGKGTIDGDILNGEFSLSIDSSLNPDDTVFLDTENILTFKLSGYDLKALKDGHTNGTLEISSDAIASVSGLTLKCKAQSEDSKSSLAVTVIIDKEEFMTIEFTSKTGAKLDRFKPSSSDTVYDITSDADMQKYTSELDIEDFLDDFSSKTGLELEDDYMDDLLEDFSGFGSGSSIGYEPAATEAPARESSAPASLPGSSPTATASPDSSLSGQYDTIEDFINSPSVQNELNTLTSTLSGSGMYIDVYAEGSKLIYAFTYEDFSAADVAGMEQILANGIETQADVFQGVADSLKLAVKVQNPSVEIQYIDSEGTIIYSRVFTAR